MKQNKKFKQAIQENYAEKDRMLEQILETAETQETNRYRRPVLRYAVPAALALVIAVTGFFGVYKPAKVETGVPGAARNTISSKPVTKNTLQIMALGAGPAGSQESTVLKPGEAVTIPGIRVHETEDGIMMESFLEAGQSFVELFKFVGENLKAVACATNKFMMETTAAEYSESGSDEVVDKNYSALSNPPSKEEFERIPDDELWIYAEYEDGTTEIKVLKVAYNEDGSMTVKLAG